MKVAFIVPYEGKKLYQASYDQIMAAIEVNGGLVVSPEKPQEYRQALAQDIPMHDQSRSHYEFIRKSIIDSDAVIVEASYEDFRVGHETTLALIYHKPVLVMAQHIDFAKFIHHPDFTAKHYAPDDISRIVKDFLAAAAGRLQNRPRPQIQKLHKIMPDLVLVQPKTIAVFGGVYADVFNKVERIPRENEVALSSDFKISLGGKATNAAVAMARLGNKAMLLGQVGHDSVATDLEATLIHEGINTDFVIHDRARPTGTVVLAVDQSAQYSTVVHEAANVRIDLTQIGRFFEKIDRQELKIDCLYLTLEAQPAAIDYVIREAAKRDIFIFCDAAPHARPLDPRLLPLVDVVAPNQIEAQAMTGVEVIDQATAGQAAAVLIRKGARQVLVTMGDQGAYWQSAKARGHHYVPALSVQAVDEAGAGDAFRGAFVAELLDSGDVFKALHSGTLAGAFAVTRFGSYDSMPTREGLAFFNAAS